jgi:hypothetical protein
VQPESIDTPVDVDIAALMKTVFPAVHLLEPSLEDYKDAERRTSYHLPPNPRKSPDGEEFRDRLIWCQLVRYTKSNAIPILIVSGDGLFSNGAESGEGKSARIDVVEDASDLDQRLSQRPHHIEEIIENILMFESMLKQHGIDLTPTSISSIEELRQFNDANGSHVRKFTIRVSGSPQISTPVSATMVSIGGTPVSLDLTWEGNSLSLARTVSQEELGQLAMNRLLDVAQIERHRNELIALLRS